jgi:hypothetical protein
MQSLSSRMFSPRRCYSSPSALKLWVKHNGGPPTKVPIRRCTNIDDFAKKIKKELNTNCQVALLSSLEKDALRPGLTIHELLKTDYSKKNSGESDDYSSSSFLNGTLPPYREMIDNDDNSIASPNSFHSIEDDGERDVNQSTQQDMILSGSIVNLNIQ